MDKNLTDDLQDLINNAVEQKNEKTAEEAEQKVKEEAEKKEKEKKEREERYKRYEEQMNAFREAFKPKRMENCTLSCQDRLDKLKSLYSNFGQNIDQIIELMDDIIADENFEDKIAQQVVLMDKIYYEMAICYSMEIKESLSSEEIKLIKEAYTELSWSFEKVQYLYNKYANKNIVDTLYAKLLLDIIVTLRETVMFTPHRVADGSASIKLLNDITLVVAQCYANKVTPSQEVIDKFKKYAFYIQPDDVEGQFKPFIFKISTGFPYLTKETISKVKKLIPPEECGMTAQARETMLMMHIVDIKKVLKNLGWSYGIDVNSFVVHHPEIFKEDKKFYNAANCNLLYSICQFLKFTLCTDMADKYAQDQELCELTLISLDDYYGNGNFEALCRFDQLDLDYASAPYAEFLLTLCTSFYDPASKYFPDTYSEKLNEIVLKAYSVLKEYPANNTFWADKEVSEMMVYHPYEKYNANYVYAHFSKLQSISEEVRNKIFVEDKDFAALINEWTEKERQFVADYEAEKAKETAPTFIPNPNRKPANQTKASSQSVSKPKTNSSKRAYKGKSSSSEDKSCLWANLVGFIISALFASLYLLVFFGKDIVDLSGIVGGGTNAEIFDANKFPIIANGVGLASSLLGMITYKRDFSSILAIVSYVCGVISLIF